MTRLIAVSMLLMASSMVRSHPFHASIAEAEWKPESKTLEVALWAHPADLEKALRRMTKKRIDLDKTKNVDALIQRYLSQVLIFKEKNKAVKLKWVGKEITIKAAWLYFEVPLSNGLEGVKITHQLFHELLEDQVNTITFRIRKPSRRRSLRFTSARPTLTFQWKTISRDR